MPKRQMWKVRYDENGEQKSWDEDVPANYIDVKLTKKAWYKQGTGPAYRDTVYTYCKKPADRRYEEDDLTIKILGADDTETGGQIKYKKRVRKATLKAGTGPVFQAVRITYCNKADGENSRDPREVREQRIPATGSGAHIKVERIKKATLANGTGPAYQKKRLAHLCNEEDQLTDKSTTELLNPDGSTRPET